MSRRPKAATGQTVGEALEALRDKDGRITPEIVVERAHAKSHPLHDRFEWDDEKAGHAYRLIQARTLITEYRTSGSLAHYTPVFVHDGTLPMHVAGYVSLASASEEPRRATAVMLEELARIIANTERARRIAEACASALPIALDDTFAAVLKRLTAAEQALLTRAEKAA